MDVSLIDLMNIITFFAAQELNRGKFVLADQQDMYRLRLQN
jgi:hypothetical protein